MTAQLQRALLETGRIGNQVKTLDKSDRLCFAISTKSPRLMKPDTSDGTGGQLGTRRIEEHVEPNGLDVVSTCWKNTYTLVLSCACVCRSGPKVNVPCSVGSCQKRC